MYKTLDKRFYRFFGLSKERGKIVALCAIKLLFSVLFTMLKMQKKSNIVLEEGAEKIPWVKSLVFVFSLLAVVGYTWCTNRWRQHQLLPGILLFFILFFALFSGLILPNHVRLSPNLTAGLEAKQTSVFWYNWLLVFQNWWKLTFYCGAELFGQFAIIIFFWGFVNELVTQEEAKRVYPLFIASGCAGAVLGAWGLGALVGRVQDGLVAQGVSDEVLTQKVSLQVSVWFGWFAVGVLLLVFVLYRWVHRRFVVVTPGRNRIEKKGNLSFLQALKHIFSNPYLLAITVMVICCAWATSLLDITYEAYVTDYTGKSSKDYTDWMMHQYIILNLVSIFASLFIARRLLRYLKWKVSAYIAPCVIMLCSGWLFVMSICYQQGFLQRFATIDGFGDPLYLVASFGRIQAIMATAVKYTFFDGTKELIFMKLPAEVRRKSKAAVDVVGSRWGKALASFTHMGVMSAANAAHVSKISPMLLFVFLFVCVCWCLSIHFIAGREAKSDVVGTLSGAPKQKLL